jgi:hypothetical protein
MWSTIKELAARHWPTKPGLWNFLIVACLCITIATIVWRLNEGAWLVYHGPPESVPKVGASDDPPVVNRARKSDSLLHQSVIARKVISDRWVEINGAVLSELITSGEAVITTPANRRLWPRLHPWDDKYGVDYKLQGDGDGAIITIWHSCHTPGPKPLGVVRQCLATPKYRRTHHLHTPDWMGP